MKNLKKILLFLLVVVLLVVSNVQALILLPDIMEVASQQANDFGISPSWLYIPSMALILLDLVGSVLFILRKPIGWALKCGILMLLFCILLITISFIGWEILMYFSLDLISFILILLPPVWKLFFTDAEKKNNTLLISISVPVVMVALLLITMRAATNKTFGLVFMVFCIFSAIRAIYSITQK